MINYIGDLSRADAALLASMARTATRILEFGAGASTQIFAAYIDTGGIVESVETDPEWIGRTARNIVKLWISNTVVRFRDYKGFIEAEFVGPYDLIFVDGVDELRAPFAFHTWPALRVGGRMCFHDTRRTKPHGASPTSDVQNVCALIERFSPEIERVDVNADDSNITVVRKRHPLPLEDWNAIEGRTPQQIGIA